MDGGRLELLSSERISVAESEHFGHNVEILLTTGLASQVLGDPGNGEQTLNLTVDRQRRSWSREPVLELRFEVV